MKNKKLTSKLEDTKKRWKRHIVFEKGCKETAAQWMAERIAALADHMQYGHALIAYHKQNGEFRLVKATLIYYEGDFKRRYDVTRIQSAMVYWNVELQSWRTFQIENFLEWKPIV